MVDNNYSRRQLLKTTAAVGSVLAGSGVASADVTDSVRRTEVVAARAGDEVTDIRRVATEWYDHHRLALQVKDELLERYGGLPGVEGVAIGGTGRRVADGPELAVDLKVTDRAPDVALPDAVGSVSVGVRDVTDLELEETYGVRGGEHLHTNLDYPGTAGWPIEYDGEPAVITAGHLFKDGDCASDLDGESAYSKDFTDEFVGYVVDHNYPDYDWAIVEDGSSSSLGDPRHIDPEIRGDSSKNLDGIASETTLHYLVGEDVQRRGHKTDSSGPITDLHYDGSGIGSCDGADYDGQVEVDMTCRGGDSGGPIYHVSGDDIRLVAIQSAAPFDASTPYREPCYGTMGFKVQEQAGGTVDGSPSY